MKKFSHKNISKIGKYKIKIPKRFDKKLANRLFRFMLRLRICELYLEKEYHPADQMKCPVHFCVGEEAIPAVLNELLIEEDFLFSHHRSHGYYLAKNAPMKKLFAELYGKSSGANSGIAGSMDLSYTKKNFFAGAILSGAASIAIGAALSLSLKPKSKAIAVTGFGDGATEEGLFWETINYAGLKKLPILFICENNNYSTYAPQSKRQAGMSIAERVRSFGVDSKQVFGNDVFIVYQELKKAITKARKSRTPFLLEAFTYRQSSHVGPPNDEKVKYKSKKEIKFWKKNCPVALSERVLLMKNFLKKTDINVIKSEIKKEIKSCFDYAKNSEYPSLNSWDDLNLSHNSPLADKLLLDLDKTDFDIEQQTEVSKGF